jgi:hypothetical protein
MTLSFYVCKTQPVLRVPVSGRNGAPGGTCGHKIPGEGAEKSIFHGESRGHLKGKTLDARLLSAKKTEQGAPRSFGSLSARNRRGSAAHSLLPPTIIRKHFGVLSFLQVLRAVSVLLCVRHTHGDRPFLFFKSFVRFFLRVWAAFSGLRSGCFLPANSECCFCAQNGHCFAAFRPDSATLQA